MSNRIDYFDEDALQSDLKGKTVRGAAYVGSSQVIQTLIQFATMPILARLLTPDDFGLVAMMAVFTGLGNLLVDAGLAMATVQRPSLTHQQSSNMFWIAGALGVATAAAVASLSPLIALFFGEPRLVAISVVTSVSFVTAGLTIQHQALLQRAMQFRAIAALRVLPVLVGQLVGVYFAWRFRGEAGDYWALVWIPIVASATRMIGSWVCSRWVPSWPQRGAGTREMVVFGANLTGSSFISYCARSVDKALLGWQFGEFTLGYYDRASRLLVFPLQRVIPPLTAIVVPALSRLSGDAARYRRAYFSSIKPLLFIACPGIAYLGVHADWIVSVILGSQWAESVPIFRWLTVVGIVQPFTYSLPWLLVSQGRGRDVLVFGTVIPISCVVAYLIGLPWGAPGVAAAYALSGILFRIPFGVWYTGRQGPVGVGALWRTLALAAPPTAAVLAANLLARTLIDFPDVWIGIISTAAISAVAWVAAMTSTTNGRSWLTTFWHTCWEQLPIHKEVG